MQDAPEVLLRREASLANMSVVVRTRSISLMPVSKMPPVIAGRYCPEAPIGKGIVTFNCRRVANRAPTECGRRLGGEIVETALENLAFQIRDWRGGRDRSENRLVSVLESAGMAFCPLITGESPGKTFARSR